MLIIPITGCFLGKQRIISYNTTLVPPSSIEASSQASSFTDDYLFHHNNIPSRLWCTDTLEGAADGVLSEWLKNTSTIFDINVTFSEPLLLTHILATGFGNSYVTNFTIAHSLEEDGPMLIYNYSSERQEFIAGTVDTVFTLIPPLATRRIRFNILDGLTGGGLEMLCWHLTLLGCILPEGNTLT